MSGEENCGRCGKSVNQADEIIAAGKKWHKLGCFTCKNCNKGLDSTTVAEYKGTGNDGEIYCKECFGRDFGPTGYGYGGGAGALRHTGKSS